MNIVNALIPLIPNMIDFRKLHVHDYMFLSFLVFSSLGSFLGFFIPVTLLIEALSFKNPNSHIWVASVLLI